MVGWVAGCHLILKGAENLFSPEEFLSDISPFLPLFSLYRHHLFFFLLKPDRERNLSWLVPLQGTRPRTWRVCWGLDIWRVYATRGQQYTPSKYSWAIRFCWHSVIWLWKKNTSERLKWNISHIFLAESLDTTSTLKKKPNDSTPHFFFISTFEIKNSPLSLYI